MRYVEPQTVVPVQQSVSTFLSTLSNLTEANTFITPYTSASEAYDRVVAQVELNFLSDGSLVAINRNTRKTVLIPQQSILDFLLHLAIQIGREIGNSLPSLALKVLMSERERWRIDKRVEEEERKRPQVSPPPPPPPPPPQPPEPLELIVDTLEGRFSWVSFSPTFQPNISLYSTQSAPLLEVNPPRLFIPWMHVRQVFYPWGYYNPLLFASPLPLPSFYLPRLVVCPYCGLLVLEGVPHFCWGTFSMLIV